MLDRAEEYSLVLFFRGVFYEEMKGGNILEGEKDMILILLVLVLILLRSPSLTFTPTPTPTHPSPPTVRANISCIGFSGESHDKT